jgi:hypothetical protein
MLNIIHNLAAVQSKDMITISVSYFNTVSSVVNYFKHLTDECQCVKEQKLPDAED